MTSEKIIPQFCKDLYAKKRIDIDSSCKEMLFMIKLKKCKPGAIQRRKAIGTFNRGVSQLPQHKCFVLWSFLLELSIKKLGGLR